MIKRLLEDTIAKQLFKGKVIILLGPRQTGKTTLIENILKDHANDSLHLDADDPTVSMILDRPNTEQLKDLIGKHKIVFIDEAQRIKDIGITSKLIADKFKKVQLILSGSSAFELASETHEPLTGRKRTYYLWPISFAEYQKNAGYLKSEQNLETRLVYGFYPEVINDEKDKNVALKELSESYLYKDVLRFGNLKKPEEIQKLLQSVSYQTGNEVSYRELAEMTGLDPKTVEKYIGILEKAFVVFRLTSFSRNLRNEIKASKKIYFYDNGIRNAVIGQLQVFSIRQDQGALWENFLISERKKYLAYNSIICNSYFWRTAQQQEVDYVEETNGMIHGYEFKLSEKKKIRFPAPFLTAYKPAVSGINRSNFREFII